MSSVTQSLFHQSIQRLIRNAPDDEKLKILQTIMNEVSQSTRTIEILYCQYSLRYGATYITIKILNKLDPVKWLVIEEFDVRLRDHPYIIQIVKELGAAAFYPNIELLQIKLPIHKHYRWTHNGYDVDLQSYIPPDLSELSPYLYENLKSPEEVSRVIQEVLTEEDIKIDREEVDNWLKDHYKKNYIIK